MKRTSNSVADQIDDLIPPPASRRTRLLVGLVCLTAAISVGIYVSGFRDDSSESAVEEVLNVGFLNPLEGVLEHEVSGCSYPPSGNELWHFSVVISVEADVETTVAVLRPSVDVINADRDPALVQQFAGNPRKGWNGQLFKVDGGTRIELVRNSVRSDDVPVGWFERCDLTTSGE